MPTYDEVMGELARQDLGNLDPYGGAAAGPLGALADQSTYNPWERATAAVRFGAKPLGGRQEGVATTLPQEILAAPVRAAAGFTKAAFDRAAEEHPLQAMTPPPVARRMGGPSTEPLPMQTSTDYDPRRMSTFLGAETALNTTGFGTPFSQTGALGSAGGKAVMGELASQAPPFYSAVERAVQGAKQNVAPGQQWAGYLRNQPGVKPEEIEALKLGQLFEQPGAVPKQAVLDQIAANRVNVGEVVKGGTDYAKVDAITAERAAVRTRLDEARQLFATDPANREIHRTRVQELADRDQALTDQIVATQGMPGSATKFGTYTLPGGENYREMLLTLPDRSDITKLPSGYRLERGMLQGEERFEVHGPGTSGRYASGDTQEQAIASFHRQHPAAGTFRGGHFDEPNILAHVRTNDRVIDGKKTLFVEEVQSDWHQKGKREGYRTADQDKQQAAYNKHVADGVPPFEAMRLAENEFKSGAVPDAPFKTTWPELAMKRIIREAAEKGYDKVAWTPGSVQAARYDLSKQIDNLKWFRNGDGTYRIRAEKGGNVVLRQDKGISENELADTIGKELAEKIVKNEEQNGTFAGLDLQVGGEGMKGFYDEILPATVNKLVKKHGGRVQQGEIAKDTPKTMDAIAQELGYGGWHSGMTAEQRAHVEQVFDTKKMPGQPVHTIDITPSLREQAMKGFPLFTAGGIAATGVIGELARQNEYRRQ